MKYFYLTIILFFSLNSFGQNGLLGEWALHSMIIDGVQDFDISNHASINFTTDPGDGNGLYLGGLGACNGFSASYVITSIDTFDIIQFYQTLVSCDTQEEAIFENKYFYDILYSVGDVTSFQYTITGTGINTTLSITNTITNNVAIYAASPENDLLGEWFLYNIEVGGVEQYSTVPNLNHPILFNNDNSFHGGGCIAYTGSLVKTSGSSFYFTNFAALATSCVYPTESNLFLNPYLFLLSNQGSELPYTYNILGEGINETLTVINSQGNKAFYGRSHLPPNNIPGTWFLHSITKDNVEELNVYEPTFNINFTLSPGTFTGLDYNGFAICKDYFGPYRLDGLDAIRLSGISYTLNICQQTGASFEDSYLLFFADANSDTMRLNYEIFGFGDDETLILTYEDGDFLTYGRQTLSVSENELTNFNIRLIENPVKAQLLMDLHQSLGNRFSYQIYTIDGKQIMASKLLKNNSINVEKLNSGMYFLVISSERDFKQTLKFIKK